MAGCIGAVVTIGTAVAVGPPISPEWMAMDVSPVAAGTVRPGASSLCRGDTLTILFTAETRGNLLPCACPGDRAGGLARRVGFLLETAERRSRGGLVLVCDAGGQLPDGAVPLRAGPATAERYVGLLLEAMEASGLVAAAVDHGQRAFLRQTAPAEARRLDPLLLDADPPSGPRRMRWGDRAVAILALEESLSDEAVTAAARAARVGTDYLCVLARADAFTGRRLARLARADLVLLSRGARPPAVLQEGAAILAGCGVDGHEIGELRLVERPNAADPTRRSLEVASFRLHPMGSGAPEDPVFARRVQELVAEAGPESILPPRE